ncbi:hypothetical protein MATL_G00119540 [Megalops atlanticus]|uniref:Extracellular calcium-sensing receptor n=1 Tax=Megalops atlanticus TaxID=7932 RepID=A0A9D3T5L3_MEGAT|nr:hypothetical protein MATL_G00119540 [Megalops atlanticus]
MSPLSFAQWMALLLPLQTWVTIRAQQTACKQWDSSNSLDELGLFQDGDVVLGGLFPLYNMPVMQDLSYSASPELMHCQGFQMRPLRWAQAMVFAVEEINRNPSLLPGVRLGYRILDSCGKHPWALRGALLMVSGGNKSCSSAHSVPVIIGEASSTQSMILSRTLGPLDIPLVSYQASCACLSDRSAYPNFFRTIPSDFYQARAMAQLAKRFGWTWVGAIGADNDYGRLAIQAFSEEVKEAGVCLAFFETVSRENLEQDAARAAVTVQRSSARVILVFAWYTDVEVVFLELARRNVTDRQFLASEAWSTSVSLLQNAAIFAVSRGVLGVAIRGAPVPGLEAHLRGVHPSWSPGNPVLKELWEQVFGCSLGGQNGSASQSLTPCGGTETLQTVQNVFTDTSQLRVTYNVYLAVYAVAHALHSQLSCSQGNTTNRSPYCASTDNLQPRQLLHHLNQVHFTTQLGEEFCFEGGDIRAVYDIVNWQDSPDGLLQYVKIGQMEGSELNINDSTIMWTTGSKMVPKSVCTEACPPGTRKAMRKGEPVCCFDCIPCADGEISNRTGNEFCVVY